MPNVFEPQFDGTFPDPEYLRYRVGEIVRVKGWAFKITAVYPNGRVNLKALPQKEVEALYKDVLVRLKRKQIIER